jgi:outer membrane autotransporter protein
MLPNKFTKNPALKATVLQGALALACGSGLLIMADAHAVPGSCGWYGESGEDGIITENRVDTCDINGEDATVSAGVTLSVGPTVTTSPSYAIGSNFTFFNQNLVNRGTITSTGTAAAHISSLVAGVYFDTMGEDAIVTNEESGIITGTINAPSGHVAGIYLGDSSGTVNNRGTIQAVLNSSASTGEDRIAAGMEMSTFSGTINNTGSISGTALAGGAGYSLLINNGSGIVNNQAGGRLSGLLKTSSGTTINNDGVIDLPLYSGPTPGTPSGIVGTFNQTASGTLRIAAKSADAGGYSQLRVQGNANIAGKAYVDVMEVNTLAEGQTLSKVVYVDHASILDGNFSAVDDNSALFNFTSVATQGEDGHIDFKITQAKQAAQIVSAIGNPGAVGAAQAFDTIIAQGASNPDMQSVIDALGKLGTEQEVSNAISQTAPTLNNSQTAAVQNTLADSGRIIQARQDSNRGMSSGDGFAGGRRVWAKAFGSRADQNDRGGIAGFSADTYGMVIGGDADVSTRTNLGAAFAYGHTDITGNSSIARNRGKVDSYQMIAYGSYALDERSEFNWQGDVGQHRTEGRRNIDFSGVNRLATASYDSWSAHLGAGLTRNYSVGEQTTLAPYVRADYTWIRDQSYTEKGADALNLKVDARDTDALVFMAGGKLMHQLNDIIGLRADAGLGYDALAKRRNIVSTFAGGGPAFTTPGRDAAPWLARAGLGLVATTQSGMEISMRYDIEGRSGITNQTASAKLRLAF